MTKCSDTKRPWRAIVNGQQWGPTVKAMNTEEARRLIERADGYGIPPEARIEVDHEQEAWDELPDCACGWRGKEGFWPRRGDRCPDCGSGLD